MLRNNFSFILILFISLVNAQEDDSPALNFCFNATFEGFRLNTTVYARIAAADWSVCAIECVKDSCCRSINYKTIITARNEENCEMLHNLVYNTSDDLLKKNDTYVHIFFNSPMKEYNATCLIPKDINECSDKSTNECHSKAVCTNTQGSYTCECFNGFSGNGRDCEDINECSESFGGNCTENSNCTNTEGSYFCSCLKGYQEDGGKCTDIDECSEKYSTKCDTNADCNNTQGSYTCKCREGYFGDGEICSAYSFESDILSSEPQEVKIKLEEWLPKAGVWKKCWQATAHGWTSGTFQGKCGFAALTLTIVKAEQNNAVLIFGGYATARWRWGQGRTYWTPAPGSFIFSLRDYHLNTVSPSKLPLKNENDENAIYRSQYRGPCFGVNDLVIYQDGSERIETNFGNTYQLPSDGNVSHLTGNKVFKALEVEVLRLP